MQKLVIKGEFMGVKPCEIELRRFLLLIGEQASGKSTIAKLIYFFQTLPDEIYNEIKTHADGMFGLFGINEHINLDSIKEQARRLFEVLYKPSLLQQNFEVFFYYDDRSFVQVSSTQYGKIDVSFERSLEEQLMGHTIEFLAQKEDKPKNIKFRNGIRSVFCIQNSDINYIVAGRSIAVTFPEIIEGKMVEINERFVEDSEKGQDWEKRRRTGNEMVFIKFLRWSQGVRDIFKTNGGSFQTLSKSLENEGDKTAMDDIERLARKILRGEYSSNLYGESIIVDGGTIVPFSDASSGQQEALRILQGLFLAVGLKNRREFFIVEEPEAHLYPLAQKEIINAFAVFLNSIPQGRLIITTHSPYILACINILLFASFVAQRVNGKSEQISVPHEYWLKAEDFTAYSLGQHEAYCTDIKNLKTGLIDQNYLDKISEELGTQYHQLYDLLTLSPA